MIVPSLTFIASVNVIRHVGATPVFAEIDPATYNIDPADAARRITNRTRVIMPVDQLGLPCDTDAIGALARRHDLRVLDDAACAFGSFNMGRPVGALADATVFSLHARKVVTTAEGGMITTDDAALCWPSACGGCATRACRCPTMRVTQARRRSSRATPRSATIIAAPIFRRPSASPSWIGWTRSWNDGAPWPLVTALIFPGHPALIAPHVPPGLTHNWQSYQIRLREDAGLSRSTVMDRLFEIGDPDAPRRHGLSFGAALSARCDFAAADGGHGSVNSPTSDAPGTNPGTAGSRTHRARYCHHGGGEVLIECPAPSN